MDTATELIDQEAPEQPDTLNALDRCDACGAQAYVSVIMESGTLLFCAHHYTKNEAALSALNPVVVDERYKLLAVAKLDVSA